MDWHAPASNRFPAGNFLIYFTMQWSSCADLAANYPTSFEETPLRYFVYPSDSNTLISKCNAVTGTNDSVRQCMVPRQLSYMRNYGHYDYHHGDIYLRNLTVDDAPDSGLTSGVARRRAFISHETGHALGLQDPGQPPNYAPCGADNSVMHIEDYCDGYGYQEFPWLADRTTANNVSDPP